MKERLCNSPDCWVYFKPKSPIHRYCGSIRLKTGCSYKNRISLNAKWNKANPQTLNAIAKRWFEKHKELRNAKRRTPEYHFKVKEYKYRRLCQQLDKNGHYSK